MSGVAFSHSTHVFDRRSYLLYPAFLFHSSIFLLSMSDKGGEEEIQAPITHELHTVLL